MYVKNYWIFLLWFAALKSKRANKWKSQSVWTVLYIYYTGQIQNTMAVTALLKIDQKTSFETCNICWVRGFFRRWTVFIFFLVPSNTTQYSLWIDINERTYAHTRTYRQCRSQWRMVWLTSNVQTPPAHIYIYKVCAIILFWKLYLLHWFCIWCGYLAWSRVHFVHYACAYVYACATIYKTGAGIVSVRLSHVYIQFTHCHWLMKHKLRHNEQHNIKSKWTKQVKSIFYAVRLLPLSTSCHYYRRD